MGGDRDVSSFNPNYGEEEFFDDQDLSAEFSHLHRVESSENVEDESLFKELDDLDGNIPLSSLEVLTNQRKRVNVYREVLRSYDQMQIRSFNLDDAKSKIVSYKPGEWIENADGMVGRDYHVPECTTLLLIGPRGSGKSSLVNRISNVFEDNGFAYERAQITYNPSFGDGTYFLQEYMIPRGSTSFCLYDTRSLSNSSTENIEMVTRWLTKGVRHGELVFRPSDPPSLIRRLKCKARDGRSQGKKARKVNFVIFVVDAITVLKSMDDDNDSAKQSKETIASTYNCPYLSFRDDKPVVVVTHGDLFSLSERARLRVHLGELLGVSPAKQIFDIPDNCDPVTNLTIIDMLRYSLEHADKNLPCKDPQVEKVRQIILSARRYLLAILALIVAIVAIYVRFAHSRRVLKSKTKVDWHTIRHLWLDN